MDFRKASLPRKYQTLYKELRDQYNLTADEAYRMTRQQMEVDERKTPRRFYKDLLNERYTTNGLAQAGVPGRSAA